MPLRPMIVIGDTHGRLDLLETLLDHLERDPDLSADRELVFLGDMVDRGADSRGVIDLIRSLEASSPERVTALMGNHETMMLDFLDGEVSCATWLRNGGVETLQSFGLAPLDASDLEESGFDDLRQDALQAIGEARLAWLRQRPLCRQSGDVIAVHAAFDRKKLTDEQDPDVLLWGAQDFYRTQTDRLPWVVHGHVVTRPPKVTGTRIAIDSGAWLGGGLTAALIWPGATPRLVTVGA